MTIKYIPNIYFLSSQTYVMYCVIPNEREESYSLLLILLRLSKDFNNIHLLFLIYRISSSLLINTILISLDTNESKNYPKKLNFMLTEMGGNIKVTLVLKWKFAPHFNKRGRKSINIFSTH